MSKRSAKPKLFLIEDAATNAVLVAVEAASVDEAVKRASSLSNEIDLPPGNIILRVQQVPRSSLITAPFFADGYFKLYPTHTATNTIS